MLAHETPNDVQGALKELVKDYERQSDQARREYVRKCLRAHEFFRGNQYLWWDARIGEYRAPTQTGGLMSGATPQFAQNLYVINIYQGFAMSLIAILTANQPTQRFFPLRIDSPEDRRAADKANELLKIFERTQKSHERLLEEVYLLWCDGTFGSYVHTVTDGDRFGWTEEKITEPRQVQLGEPSYLCPQCGAAGMEPGSCQGCGAPLGPEALVQPPTVTREEVVGTKKKAKSKVVWDIVGGLELKLPPTAKTQAEFPYLIRAREVPKSAVRATYPEMANKIGRRVGGGNLGDTDTVLEVRARRQTSQGTTIDNRSVLVNQGDDVTLKEIWLRSTSFWQVDDERMRARLLEMFPDGCRVVFADDMFCEVIPENMDDHWRVCHALPGRGQVREPIGGTLIQIQEIVNDMTNIVRDVIEFTMPATFVDNEVLDVKKWARSNVIPGATYNVRPRGNRPVSDAFWQTQPGQLPQYTAQLLSEMRTQVPQFTVGAFPAAYGGGTPGNSTAALDVNVLIPTPSGFVTNKDIEVGASVFGEDGKTYSVTAVHPIYKAPAYRVMFDDGSEVIADDRHRWRTLSAKEREQIGNRVLGGRKKRPGKTGPKPVSVPVPSFKTTAEIRASLLDKRGRSNHAIPVSAPVEMSAASLPLDPWVLGVWLGDGSRGDGRIACSNEDGPEMARLFSEAGWELKKIGPAFTWYAKGLRTVIRKMGLLLNKHIPDEYLWASREQRLALLQGLMDTDGCATTEGKQFFHNTNRALIDGVYHLAASLGCKPRVVETKPGLVGGAGEKEYTRKAGWSVYWSSALPVFRLKRKLARVNVKPKRDARRYRYIVAVDPVGEREVRCITVSNPTECFLVSRDFVCTGNSGIALEKDAAMGRIGIYWRIMKQHHSEVAPLLIREFSRRAEDPETLTEAQEGGALANIVVSPSDFDTGEIQTFPESTEDYPTTWPQRQGMLMQGFQNPLLQGDMMKLSNWDYIKRTLGVEIEHRGEKSYKMQWDIIDKLIQTPPQMVPVMDPMTGQPPMDPMTGQPVIDPMTGQPPMQPQTTIPPGELDDHASMLEACMDFDVSERGQKARLENPQGYQNFLLHALARKAAMAPPMPPGPPGPGGAPPGGPPGPQQGGGNG